MMNAQQPTRRMRHVDIRHFAVMQWVSEDYLIYNEVQTAHNPSDSLTKQTGRIKFHEQMDVIMGRRVPRYSYLYDKTEKMQEPATDANAKMKTKTTTKINQLRSQSLPSTVRMLNTIQAMVSSMGG